MKPKEVKGEKREWTILKNLTTDAAQEKVDKLFELYAEDKQKARNFFYLSNEGYVRGSSSFEQTWIKVSENKTGRGFRIRKVTKKVGISKKNNLHISWKTDWALSFSAKGAHIYTNMDRRHPGKVICLTYANMPTSIVDEVTKRVPVFKAFLDLVPDHNGYNGKPSFSFYKLFKYKLFTLKKYIRFIYGIPLNKFRTDVIDENGVTFDVMNRMAYHYTKTKWKENVNPELFKDASMLKDTRRFMNMWGEDVKWNWSRKRLRAEHDAWFNKYMIEKSELGILRKITPNKAFTFIKDHLPDWRMIEDNTSLYTEGNVMKHCVASYSGKINNGICAIYHWNKYTLEIRVNKQNKYYVAQMKGYANASPDPKHAETAQKAIYQVNRFVESSMTYNEQDELFENVRKDGHRLQGGLFEPLEDDNRIPYNVNNAELINPYPPAHDMPW